MREWPLQYGIIISRQEFDVDGHMTVFTHTVPIEEDRGLFFINKDEVINNLSSTLPSSSCIPATALLLHVFYTGKKARIIVWEKIMKTVVVVI